jgi:hypothetical protein
MSKSDVNDYGNEVDDDDKHKVCLNNEYVAMSEIEPDSTSRIQWRTDRFAF